MHCASAFLLLTPYSVLRPGQRYAVHDIWGRDNPCRRPRRSARLLALRPPPKRRPDHAVSRSDSCGSAVAALWQRCGSACRRQQTRGGQGPARMQSQKTQPSTKMRKRPYAFSHENVILLFSTLTLTVALTLGCSLSSAMHEPGISLISGMVMSSADTATLVVRNSSAATFALVMTSSG